MHAYSTDAQERRFVPAVLAVIAVVTALTFNRILVWMGVGLPWWFDTPAVVGFYGLIFKFYDLQLWRRALGPVRLSGIPDIKGTWAGTIAAENWPAVPVVVWIRQSWSKIDIRLESTESRSFSTMACVNTDDSREHGLKYEFCNEPKAHSKDTMQAHRGMAWLRLSSGTDKLNGEYFSGRGRQNVGSVELDLISRDLLSYDEALTAGNKEGKA
ncbi:MAG TPA: hypothetical protein PKJ78_22470 [Candidatus Hydrogenedentes bacterium]|nr:hypothetical protein [Candidatus Hydrogenedentota bacterium]